MTKPAIAILGFGAEGQSSYEYYRQRSRSITICDANPEIELGLIDDPGIVCQTGPDYLSNLDQFDLIVRSPGLNPSLIAAANRPTWTRIAPKITTQTNEFIKLSGNRTIAVTGSKGKGTTCRLIVSLLGSIGHRAIIGGNIGEPPLNLLKAATEDPKAIVVLEVSSFQAIDLKESVETAVMLPVSPDHLNYHGSISAYIEAKANLLRQQSRAGIAVISSGSNPANKYFHKNIRAKKIIRYAGRSQSRPKQADFWIDSSRLMARSGPILAVDRLKHLPGEHNLLNLSAAVAAVSPLLEDINRQRNHLAQAASNFRLPRFRYETINQTHYPGIKFINDSGSTSPEATIAAIQTAAGVDKILIVGGQEKDLSVSKLVRCLADPENKIKRLIALGPGGARVATSLKSAPFPVVIDPGPMPAIVAAALIDAKPGDTILFSPGFTSFGQFKNSTDRGQQFEQAVLGAQGDH